jgi:uncharacterized membrane protein
MDDMNQAAPQPSQEAPKQEAPKEEVPKVEAQPVSKPAGDNEMIFSIISYIWILFLIPLLVVNPKSEALKFHIRQGIVLFLLSVVLALLPYRLSMLNIIPTILAIVAIYNVVNGKQWEIPFLGEYAKKIKL